MGRKRDMRRYWIRLDTSYFTSEIHRRIMATDYGFITDVIYFTICALVIENNGILFDERDGIRYPFTAGFIRRLYPQCTEEQIQSALDTLALYNLIELTPEGGCTVNGYREMEGHETNAAREYRFKRYGAPCYFPWESERERRPAPVSKGERGLQTAFHTDTCRAASAAPTGASAALDRPSPPVGGGKALPDRETSMSDCETPMADCESVSPECEKCLHGKCVKDLYVPQDCTSDLPDCTKVLAPTDGSDPDLRSEHAYNNTRARGVTSTYVSISESDRNEGTTLRNTPDRNLGTYVNIRRDENDYDSEGKLDRIGGMGGREGRKGTSDPSALETPETGIFNPAGFRTDATESTDPGEDTGQETLFGPDPMETEKPKKARAGRNREPAGPPVLTIPTKEGYDYGVTQRQIDTLREIYPDVDVMMNIRRIAARFENSPESRIGIAGVYRYLDNWMANEHRDAKKPADTPDRPKPASPGPDRSEPASPGPASPEDDSLASEPWYDPNDPYVIHGTDEELLSTDPNVDLLHDPYYLAEKALWKRFMGGA